MVAGMLLVLLLGMLVQLLVMVWFRVQRCLRQEEGVSEYVNCCTRIRLVESI